MKDEHRADLIIDDLKTLLPGTRINFDLDDCDKILRIESPDSINIPEVERYFKKIGYEACVLE